MSEALRNTKTIYDAFVSVSRLGTVAVRPGDLVQYMRERNDPMGIWKITEELNKLHELGLVRLEEDFATWHLIATSWEPTWSPDAQ